MPLLLGTGLYLTIRLGGIQFRTLGRATRHAFIDTSSEGAGVPVVLTLALLLLLL